METKNFLLKVPKEWHDRLSKKAYREGRTVSVLMRTAIRDRFFKTDSAGISLGKKDGGNNNDR